MAKFGFVSRLGVGNPVGSLGGVAAAGLLLVVAPGFAFGAPNPGDFVFNAVKVAITWQGLFPSKEVGFSAKLFSRADLSIGGVVVGSAVGVILVVACFVTLFGKRVGGGGSTIRLDDFVSPFKLCLEGNNVINVSFAGNRQFLFLPSIADEHQLVLCLCHIDQLRE